MHHAPGADHGCGGRDFHDFNVVFRDDPAVEVVAFTATQIPGIADRRYPPALAGSRYPEGIPIHDEVDLADLIEREAVDEVVFAYSDVAHPDVMHRASTVLASGADFRLLGPRSTELAAPVPVIAVCAVRTGCGKSPTSRRVVRLLAEAGFDVGLVRHPMPYGDLAAQAVQRFGSLADIDAAEPTIEEREEYELPVAEGTTVWAGVDYGAIVEAAGAEHDVLVWDGGNNDLPFFTPDLLIAVADALRPGHETAYHPGEAVLRRADVVLVNKVDAAAPAAVDALVADIEQVNPWATVIRAASPVTLDDGPALAGVRVLCVEDGPTSTHGGQAEGAAVAAAEAAGAVIVDGRTAAVGTIAETFGRYPHLGRAVPAMGYSPEQVADLQATLRGADAEVIVSGTPFDLGRLVTVDRPIRRVTYSVAEVGPPTLADVVAPFLTG